MAKKMVKDVGVGSDLVRAINDLIESRVRRIIKQQGPRIEKGLSDIERALNKLDKRITRKPVPRKAARRKVRRVRPKAKPKARAKGKKVCKMPGCNKPSRSRGLCGAHYVAALRKGKFKGIGAAKVKAKAKPKARAKGKKVWKMPGCNKPSRSRGLCGAHYVAALRKGKFKGIGAAKVKAKKAKAKAKPKAKAKGKKVCKMPGCNKPSRSRGLCAAHYMAGLRKGKFKKK